MRTFYHVRIIMLTILLISAAGCATVSMATKEKDAEAKNFIAQQDISNIYIYRVSSFGAAVKYPVVLDGKMLGELPGGTFIFVTSQPGQHTIHVTAERSKIETFTAEPGKNYYIMLTPRMGMWTAGAKLTLMTDEKQAQEDVKKCKLIQSFE